MFHQICEDLCACPAFCCALNSHRRDLTFLEHLGFLLYPITSNGSFLFVALPAHIPVSLTLLCWPLHFFSFISRVLFCSDWKKRTNSSELQISSNLFIDNTVDRWVSFQRAVVISGVHDFSSSDTVLNLILLHVFHPRSIQYFAISNV